MGRYYFAVNAFPTLAIGLKPEISYSEVRSMLELNLKPEDWKQVVFFQRLSDLRNIRALWLKEPLNGRGNFSEKELEEELLVGDLLPQFISDFLDRYETPTDRLRYFSYLYAAFYLESIEQSQGFLKSYFQFEREVRLILTALRSRSSGRDLSRELQFEDFSDPLVALLLAQKEGDPVVPQEYEELKIAFLENRSEPRKLQRAILEFRFSRIEELEADAVMPFGMEQILGYLARLDIVEEWETFDKNLGKAALEQIVRS